MTAIRCPRNADSKDGGQLSDFPIAEATLTAQVTFVLRGQFGVPDGYCVMGLRGIEPKVSPADMTAEQGKGNGI